ncbi:transcription factor GTE10-like isoform X1 [Salvia hispanica]|uniref:transcription factor GTE10-like isoform X1 n=1 Tax=Salvia hispanica TaxID=49212 RepID=UPI002009DB24|nr:transcription factor GTE10-like isoform X1 [Salvia hispanica]XP_047940550.1 transcription factor GTE10-like isoform X1 [Salvia hispanica]XP_047940551.1 transcription factor GTE10-like isoform X1 [Salvia hispanica]XP_047940552.1 transcription factor GTE10-like isoform X1 [Salvia hispanica]
MAPAIPIDYTGHKESKKFSKKVGLGDMMGKTRKVSTGYSSGFVPDYRHAVETVAESEGFGNAGRPDAGLNSLQDACVPSGKCIGFNVDDFGRSVVPIRTLSLLKMSSSERRDLEIKLKSELEQVRKFNRKIASFSLDRVVHPHTTGVHNHQTGAKRLATAESLPMSTMNDEAVTPGKKKGHSGRNGPRTKGGPLAARKTESVKHGLPQNTSFVILMKQCETLLNRLMVQPHAWIFNKPVDVVAHKVPEYFDIIKHPMDLGTVKSKLLSNQYSTPMEFAADVRLTFKNAMTFNPPKHDVHIMAEIMNKYFEVRWKSIEKKLPPTADDSTASKSSVIIEPESAYMPRAKKQKIASKEPRARHERDKPAMSDVEKQKLGTELEELMAELPDNIINFLKESTLHGSEVTEDEIEIDIDALTDDTLFTLRKLLDDYLLEKKKRQSTSENHDTEMQRESGFRDSSYLPCEDHARADEDVDIGGNDPPPMSSSPPIRIDKDVAERNSNCSGSRSSSSESGSSSTDSENSSACEADGTNISVTAGKATNDQEDLREKDLRDQNDGDILDGNADQYPMSSIEPNCPQEGESAPPDRQVSPDKLYRAAILRSRFADIIIKAQENTTEKGTDSERLKLEKEELERRRREEKARLQAEAKAAEEARRKAEAEAAAEARRQRELEREAARQALQQMEKTVDINENSQFMEDLEMFRAGPDEHLQSFIDEASPENSQNGLGSFKFPANSNPLEKLGLYMKNDEEEEDEAQPQSIEHEPYDTEEGEID